MVKIIKNLKNQIILIFILLVIIGIIIGYIKSKKVAREEIITSQYLSILEEKNEMLGYLKGKRIMSAKPKVFEIEQEKFTPVNYVYRISMKEKLTIIDESGNVVKSSSPQAMFYNLFAYNIIDTDIKTEGELKESIKFKLQPQLQEEYYPGISEEFEIQNKFPEIKKTSGVIKTNL